MSSSKTTMLDTILKLRYSGFSMIPSGRGKDGKAPAISWVDYQERLPSEEKIRKWFVRWSKQWGMVTGKISDIVVVDVDPGADISIMEGLEPHVRTPRDGGHYYFKHPGYAVKTTAGILPKIDIRGDGGFVNVVGTNPKTGGKYTIEIMPTRDRLYPWDRMPKAIIEAIEKGKKKQEAKPGEPIPEGKRDSTLTSLAGSMRKRGMTQAAIEAALLAENRDRCQPPLEDEQVAKIAKSVSRYEPEQKAAPEAPRIISARELNGIELPPLKFAIPGMIPDGMTILAGKPKSGKSWLALQVAYSVALGKNLLDGSKIERGGALVLGLEDGQRRLQDRIRKLNASGSIPSVPKVTRGEGGGIHIHWDMGEDIPDGLDLATLWPKIEEGGIEELEKYLDSHPETRLIVVDIIKRIQKKKGKGTTYDEDYQSIQPLQELATRRRVAILGVHHVRKALSDDPLDMVSGTFGLTGGVDSVLVMQREEGDFRLSVQGRDIEERELAIKFDDCLWRLMGNAGDYFMSEERAEILGCLTGEGLTPKEIAELLGKDDKRSTIRSLLAKMLRDDQVSRDNEGRYSTKKPEGGA